MRMKRAALVISTAALVVAGTGVAHAEGVGARQCHVVTWRVPGQPLGEAIAAAWRADKRDYFTATVTDRYSPRVRWSYVSAVPKHC